MVVAYLIGHNLNLDLISVRELSSNLLVLSVLNTLIFFNFKTYSGIVRYTGVQDAFRVTFSLLIATGNLDSLCHFFISKSYRLPGFSKIRVQLSPEFKNDSEECDYLRSG